MRCSVGLRVYGWMTAGVRQSLHYVVNQLAAGVTVLVEH